MFKILSRNRDYNGISAGVQFKRGVGYTDNPRAICWFEEHGYKVNKNENIEVEENKEIENENIKTEKDKNTEVEVEKEIDYTSLSYQDLKKIAAKKNINSFKVKKNELIEKLENLK